MDPFANIKETTGQVVVHRLSDLMPSPAEEWQRMKTFLALGQTDFDAMVETIEPLFRRGHELVVGAYDHLLQNRETAVILGWEKGADEAHLSERRRFFSVWLARTLGMDFSDDFAHYLFLAGKIHAAHGPRRIHVPEVFVAGSISLVNATFAQFLAEDMPGNPVVPTALAGWNKVLTMHQHLMSHGYRAALQLDSGDFSVPLQMFGRMRDITGRHEMRVRLADGATMATVLKKFFDYFPEARPEVLTLEWEGAERLDATGIPWFEAEKIYRVKPMWRVLLNGKDLDYIGGLKVPVHPGDEVSIYPPGR